MQVSELSIHSRSRPSYYILGIYNALDEAKLDKPTRYQSYIRSPIYTSPDLFGMRLFDLVCFCWTPVVYIYNIHMAN